MKTLFIIFGGPGKEHEVSLSSGRYVAESLNEKGIAYKEMLITKDGSWVYDNNMLTEESAIRMLKESNALVFQLIHGTYGEDGKLAHLLEKENISFIGSSSSSLILTIDKFKTEKLLEEKGVQVPRSMVVASVHDLQSHTFSFPLVVKPKNEGSSVSLYKVKDIDTLYSAVSKILEDYKEILVQEYILGREFTCGVVEIGGEVTSLLPSEIILTKGDTFDYEAKYTVGGCIEVTPAEIDNVLTKKIQELAKKVHTLCGCKDISRTDIIVKENGELVVLEINTIPGMTKTSFIPAQLKAAGYTLPSFVEGLLQKYS